MKRKKCNPQKSINCGATCITKAKACRKEFVVGVGQSLTGSREVVRNAKLELAGVPIIGEGAFGVVYDNGDGTVTKRMRSRSEIVAHLYGVTDRGDNDKKYSKEQMDKLMVKGGTPEEEYQKAKLASDLGFGPKVISQNKTNGTFQMEKIEGKTLAAHRFDQRENYSENLKLAAKSVDALSQLHEKGYTHGDYHTKNQIVDSSTGEVRVIDLGGMKPAPGWKERSDELVRAIQYARPWELVKGGYDETSDLVMWGENISAPSKESGAEKFYKKTLSDYKKLLQAADV